MTTQDAAGTAVTSAWAAAFKSTRRAPQPEQAEPAPAEPEAKIAADA